MILNYKDEGKGDIVVLLHGMASSLRYWDELMPELVKHRRVIRMDLLGFGRSPMPNDVTYDTSTHLQSIQETLEHIGIKQPFTLAAHSMGALLSLQFALHYPKAVRRLVLFSMPIYKTPSEARRSITKGTRIREFAYYGPSSRLLCTVWCRFLRPLSQQVARLYLPSFPAQVAKDSVRHTWQSYEQSLHHVISHQQVEKDLASVKVPAKLIYGDEENPITLANLDAIKKFRSNISIIRGRGTHNFPLENPEISVGLILDT